MKYKILIFLLTMLYLSSFITSANNVIMFPNKKIIEIVNLNGEKIKKIHLPVNILWGMSFINGNIIFEGEKMTIYSYNIWKKN